MSDERTEALEPQADGTCPACGRFVQIACSVHGPMEGDPWAEVERLREENDTLREMLDVRGVSEAAISGALAADDLARKMMRSDITAPPS